MEYHLEHVRDFLKIPPDRIDDCLAEFKDILATVRAMDAAVHMIAEADGLDDHSGPLLLMNGICWKDDGARDLHVAFNLTPTPAPEQQP